MSQEKNELSVQDQIEREAEILAKQEEASVAPVASLGKAQKFQEPAYTDEELGADLGWKMVPLENLPSQGYFYEAGTQVAIRAATVAEIRHWSTIDDNDLLSIDEMLNFIIEKCCRIKVPGKAGSYKDLKEIDRFYLIFAIRDFTFKNGENKLFVTASNEDGSEDKIEVTKDIVDYFNPDEKLLKYLNASRQCFEIRMKNGEAFDLYLPSLGTMMFIKNYVNGKRQSGQKFDKAFVKYAPFLFPDWKILTQAAYDKAVQESYTWSVQKISVMETIVSLLASSVNPQVRYQTKEGGEQVAPLNFRGGFKSLFLISDIFGELV